MTSAMIMVRNHEEDSARSKEAALHFGQSVLVRWEVDGWYYPHIIQGYLGGNVYAVTDEDGTPESVDGSHLVLCSSCFVPDQLDDQVLAEHPNHPRSYLPGLVKEFEEDDIVVVVYYDGTATRLPVASCFKLPTSSMYTAIVDNIHRIEKERVGKKVITRYDLDGLFYQGSIMASTDVSHVYTIALDDGHVIPSQLSIHIHEVSAEAHPAVALDIGDAIIALYYQGTPASQEYEFDVYGPAVVEARAGTDVRVRFWNGKGSRLPLHEVISIGQEYYDHCVDYIRQCATSR